MTYGPADREHDERLIRTLTEAVITDEADSALDNDYGPRMVRLGHLYGRYQVCLTEVSAEIMDGSDWSRTWQRASFGSFNAAKAYARAAVVGELKALAADVIANARRRLDQETVT